MKFLSLIMWLGGLCTDANDADDTDNYAPWTNHDYIGSFGRIPNEPKPRDFMCSESFPVANFRQ